MKSCFVYVESERAFVVGHICCDCRIDIKVSTTDLNDYLLFGDEFLLDVKNVVAFPFSRGRGCHDVVGSEG